MSKERPDFQDAELTLRLYELRREAVMRESRNAINGKFWPKSYEEFSAITQMEHPLNAAFRQTSSYWEMVYGMAKHGIAHADYLAENNGEGMFLYAKALPYLDKWRKEANSPTAFQNVEWITKNSVVAQKRLELIKARVEQMMAKMG